ncbi:glycosyltransferase [Prosthecochloris vibrioformis]|uniref:Glycosyltransferase n=1 Tax=Prosthecochloris vibrioformis TaxID=1098 RepID=A0A5C4RRV3_PROVB|nr:glycosyltransferase [Prosthecochloris vibrioformis]TNJ34063.1 glycosyltransferase [Prosthecochloris vibrioformis]
MVMLSVITAVLNDLEGLKRTYESLSLINVPYEWIVIDGLSDDGTVEWVYQIDMMNIKIISEKDDGIYDAMNKGVRLANGEWLYFLNAGDFMKIDVGYVLAKGRCVDVISGRVELYSSNLVSLNEYHPSFNGRINGMVNSNCIAHQGSFINKKVFCRFGEYKIKYKVQGDFEYWIRLMYSDAIFLFLSDVVAGFVVNGASSNVKSFYGAENERVNVLLEYGAVKWHKSLILKFRAFLSLCFMLVRRVLKVMGE